MATSLEAVPCPNSAGLASCCASPGKAAITSGFVMFQRTERQTGGGSVVVVVVGGSVVVGAALGGATVARAAGGVSLPLHEARPAATAKHPTTTRRRRFRMAVM